MIKSDLEMIIHKLPEDLGQIRIYPVGDTQIGSENFNVMLWNNWKKRVMEDPNGYIVIVGDMLNNALKTSKSNSYADKMRPRDAKAWLIDELRPLAERGKILGAVTGNHELRSTDLSDDCPLFDVMQALNLAHLYRENLAFIKINVGKRNGGRQVSYAIALGHGVSKTKTEKFAYAIEGIDFLITGHIHQPMSRFPAKLVFDPHNNVIRKVGFAHIVVPSFDEYGGYTMRGMYTPEDSGKIPIIILNGKEKEVDILWKSEKSM